MNTLANRQPDLDFIDRVDAVAEEVKVLALNLAIYLAKAKAKSCSEELSRLEPDFVRLVNGTVNAVQAVGRIVSAARNSETMTYDPPSGKVGRDQLEVKLRSILDQCGRIMTALSRTRDLSA